MNARRLAATYSIVAVDRTRGLMGAAVQSHYFSVGPVVPWAQPGVGCVVTQALVNPDWGPAGLSLLAEGLAPEAVIDRLTAGDDGRHGRQFAALTPDGRSAAWTGARCIGEAGHMCSQDVSAQANMMADPLVPEAMVAAWDRSAELELPERLLSALDAAEAAGGDLRGRQSAAIVIVTTDPRDRIREARPLELRVEDAREPLVELRRLLKIHRAYEAADRGDELLMQGDGAASIRAFARAAELAPEVTELQFWRALSTAAAGELSAARALLTHLPEDEQPRWLTLATRMPPTGLIDLDSVGWDRLVGSPPGALYHLVPRDEYAAEAAYHPGSLDSEGFVHCSFAHQIERTWEVHFARRADLLVLRIDPDRIESEVRVEDSYGSLEAFPHIYGALSPDAVVHVADVQEFLAGYHSRCLDWN